MNRIIPILIGLHCFSALAETKELTIASDPWCPYSCEENSAKEGFVVDVTRAVFEPLGYKVKYVLMPWPRCLEELRKGGVDLISTLDETDNAGLIMGVKPVTNVADAYFVRSDSKINYNENDINSLKGLTIGIRGGGDMEPSLKGAMGQYVKANLNNSSVIYQVNGGDVHAQLISMLVNKRVDMILDTEKVIRYNLDKMKLVDKVKFGGIVTKPLEEFLGFSPVKPNSKELSDIFDKRLEELKKDGTYNKIIRNYGLSD